MVITHIPNWLRDFVRYGGYDQDNDLVHFSSKTFRLCHQISELAGLLAIAVLRLHIFLL